MFERLTPPSESCFPRFTRQASAATRNKPGVLRRIRTTFGESSTVVLNLPPILSTRRSVKTAPSAGINDRTLAPLDTDPPQHSLLEKVKDATQLSVALGALAADCVTALGGALVEWADEQRAAIAGTRRQQTGQPLTSSQTEVRARGPQSFSEILARRF